MISNKKIIFQFARSGWGSVWHSLLAGTPIVAPYFNPKDDLEIYFNNKAVEALGLGVIYRGQPLVEILEEREKIRTNYSNMRQYIKNTWGTLDGNAYCAKMFTEDFLKNM